MINTYRRENEIKFYRKKENMEQRRRMRAWKLPQQWAAASSGIAHVACEVQPKCGACPDCCTAPDKSPSLTPSDAASLAVGINKQLCTLARFSSNLLEDWC